MNESTPTSCRDSPINAYWNNATDTPDQTLPPNAALLPAFLSYVIVGGIASVINIFCILIFITKKVRFMLTPKRSFMHVFLIKNYS